MHLPLAKATLVLIVQSTEMVTAIAECHFTICHLPSASTICLYLCHRHHDSEISSFQPLTAHSTMYVQVRASYGRMRLSQTAIA